VGAARAAAGAGAGEHVRQLTAAGAEQVAGAAPRSGMARSAGVRAQERSAVRQRGTRPEAACRRAGAGGSEARRRLRHADAAQRWSARVEQQRDVGQGRARLGRARMELRRGGSGQTRTEGSEAEHGGSLARAAAEGPATRQGRGERGSGNRRRRSNCAGQRRAEQRREGRRCAAHGGVSTGRAQAATEYVYRKVARGAGGAAARRFGWAHPGGSRVARDGRRRPLRRKQRTRSGGTRTTRGGFGDGQVRADHGPRGRRGRRVWCGGAKAKVRAELNRRVRECEQNCFASGRLGSIPQASARARQQATRERAKSQWCESNTGAVCRGCDQARQSCRRLRECADCVSAAHAREQWRLSP
jgi:hypothetical protein